MDLCTREREREQPPRTLDPKPWAHVPWALNPKPLTLCPNSVRVNPEPYFKFRWYRSVSSVRFRDNLDWRSNSKNANYRYLTNYR